jgi:hypothetical protein
MAKWNLNAFNGHILIYSPVRLASWRHAEAAVQLLLEAATVAGPPSSNILERQCMGRSILLLAVEDPSNYFKNEDSNQLLREGAQLAEKTGCRFMALGPSMPHGAQFQLYSEFFGQLLHNQPLPNLPYTVCAPNQSSFAIKRSVLLRGRRNQLVRVSIQNEACPYAFQMLVGNFLSHRLKQIPQLSNPKNTIEFLSACVHAPAKVNFIRCFVQSPAARFILCTGW